MRPPHENTVRKLDDTSVRRRHDDIGSRDADSVYSGVDVADDEIEAIGAEQITDEDRGEHAIYVALSVRDIED
jgi:hypothetical protein